MHKRSRVGVQGGEEENKHTDHKQKIAHCPNWACKYAGDCRGHEVSPAWL